MTPLQKKGGEGMLSRYVAITLSLLLLPLLLWSLLPLLSLSARRTLVRR